MKPRPTAADRELADVFRKLSAGTHMVTVIDTAATLMFDHRPVLKSEGTTIISLEDKTIYVGCTQENRYVP